MAIEDYMIGDVNISTIFKQEKVNYGLCRWYKLYEKYLITSYVNKNNIILFTIGDKEFYYGIPSQKVRKKGDSKWTGKIVELFKNEFDELPIRKEPLVKKDKLTPESEITFGKYKGMTYNDLYIKDEGYFIWALENTKDTKIKKLLYEIFKNKLG